MLVSELVIEGRRVKVAHHANEHTDDVRRRAAGVLALARGDAGALGALERCLTTDATLHAGRAFGLADRNRSGIVASEAITPRIVVDPPMPSKPQTTQAVEAAPGIRRRKGETEEQAEARAAKVRDLAAECISPLYSDEIYEAVLADVNDELARSSSLDAETVEQYVSRRLDTYRRVERIGPEPVDASLPGLSEIFGEGAL